MFERQLVPVAGRCTGENPGMALFDRRTAANSLIFLEQMIVEMPFPIQRIQTDRGREFFAYKFQERLKEYAIKFRPIKPRSPHLNGKVGNPTQKVKKNHRKFSFSGLPVV
jgi:transposase InsO family protein